MFPTTHILDRQGRMLCQGRGREYGETEVRPSRQADHSGCGACNNAWYQEYLRRNEFQN